MRNKKLNTTACADDDRTLLEQFKRDFQDDSEPEETEQKQNTDESILETFIQWMTKADKSKKEEQVKAKEKPDKGKKKLNFLKRNRPDTKDPSTSDELRTLNERLSRLESNPFLQNVHFSRPSTPMGNPVPSTSTQVVGVEPAYDKYRLMYLLVSVEKQLEHMRKVIKKMQENGAKRSRVRSVSKVMRQLENQHKQLRRILANDPAMLAEIGDADDMELFFQNIESICSATQEITFDDEDENEVVCNSLLSNGNRPDVILMKNGKVRMKKTESSCDDVRAVFGGQISTQEPISEEMRRKNTKEFLEKYRNRCSKKDANKSSQNGGTNKLMYKSEAIDSWSDTDTDEEISGVQAKGQSCKWPLLNTNDEKRMEKEKKLHTLMTEIDDLMQDVGLADNKSRKNGITYEVLMMGSGEMTKKAEKKEAPKKKYKQFDTDPDRFKGAKSKNPTTLREAKSVKKSKSQSDQFVEEFDRFLNECDSKK